jgi:hypothetical protein
MIISIKVKVNYFNQNSDVRRQESVDRSQMSEFTKRLPSWTGGVAPRRRAKRSDIGDGVVESKQITIF